LDEAIEQVATDRMVSYFFAVDFEMLSETEGDIVRIIARQSDVSSKSLRDELSLGPDALEGTLRRLANLGFIRMDMEQGLALANYFFRRWLNEMQDYAIPSAPTLVSSDAEVVEENNEDQSPLGIFAEMRRRSVFRVGIAYTIAAWLLLQIGEIAFDFLEVPIWAGKLLIVFLVLGLPVALILAWAFELTPEGVKRDRGQSL